MKKLTYILIFGLWSVSAVFAQSYCLVSIPAQAEAIRKNPIAERMGKGKTYWICNNAKVIFRFGDAVCFVESGATLVAMRGNYTVYLKENARLEISIGAKCKVYHEANASIKQENLLNQIEFYPCRNLVYDYSNAPDNSCPKINESYTSEEMIDVPVYAPEENNTDRPTNTEVVSSPSDTLPPDYKINHIIPATALVIRPNEQNNASSYNSHQVFWLCEGANFQYQGNHSVIYVESNATLSVKSGSSNIIYLKNGANISLGITSQNKVYYVEGVNLLLNRGKNTFTKLLQMDFDYTEANPNSCR